MNEKKNDLPPDEPCPDDAFRNAMKIPDANYEKLAQAIIARALRDCVSDKEEHKIDSPMLFLKGHRGIVSKLWFDWAKLKFMKESMTEDQIKEMRNERED